MPETNSEHQQRWSRFIEARQKLIASLEKPIYTKGKSTDDNTDSITLDIDQEYSRSKFYKSLKSRFGLTDNKIDYDNGHFFLDRNTAISKKELADFKDVAEALYFDYEPLPFLQGSFSLTDKNVQSFSAYLKRSQFESKSRHKEKALKVGISVIEELRVEIEARQLGDIVRLKDTFGVILKFEFNYRRLIEAALEEQGLRTFVDILGTRFDGTFSNTPKIWIRNKRLREEELITVLKELDFTLRRCEGLILAKKADGTLVPITREFSDAFCTYLFRRFTLHEREGYVESKVADFRYIFTYAGTREDLKRAFQEKFQGDIKALLLKLKGAEIRSAENILYFEASDRQEFEQAIDQLKSSPLVHIFYNPDGFKVKVKYDIISPLAGLEAKLKLQYPNLQTWISEDGSSLYFRYFFELENRVGNTLDFRNYIESLEEKKLYQLTMDESNVSLKFLAKENLDAKQFQETDKIAKLLGEEFGFGEGREYRPFGKLKKFSFPTLTLTCLDPDAACSNDLIEIRPNIRGEREKNDRLFKALEKITANPKKLPNTNLSQFIFDSSKAKRPKDESQLNPDSDIWAEIEQHSYLRLNDSQKRAIASTLLAPELALVQGPPGTGKSTAISQIIWHHIRRNQCQRILLTSETNMAVDNALEKLENERQNLVKPIRIGRESILESEGARFSLPRIKQWTADESKFHIKFGNNAVCQWIHNISSRSKRAGKLPADLQKRWNNFLEIPLLATKQLFTEQYIKHVNIIAATGSSIGERTTDFGFTNFYKQYLEVFDSEKFKSKFIHREKVTNFKPVAFNVAVVDEASKASPPELALPLTYSKKSIIIGDHRQLPPMLDENDFKSTLESIGEHHLASSFTKEDSEISQFERLFLNPNIPASLKSTFDTQYRMHGHINEVIKQFYVEDGGLNCGIPDDIADVPDLAHPLSRYHGISSEGFVSPEKHLIWVNVDEPEIKEGTSRVNHAEVEAVRRCIKYLKNASGFQEFQHHWTKEEDKEIALISFYGKQLLYLSEMAEEFSDDLPVRVRTVDKFQGMERNIVIVSLVRSNKLISSRFQSKDLSKYPDNDGYPYQDSLGFAEFPNRLNVALSRAKRLLIIVGNSNHFTKNECYQRVYETVQRLGNVINYNELTKYSV